MSRPRLRCLSSTLYSTVALFVVNLPVVAQEYESLFAEAAELGRQQNFQSAIAKYEAALKLRPNAPEALSNLAVTCYAARQYARAEKIAAKVLDQQPRLLPAQIVLGLSRVQTKQYASAMAPLQEALTVAPHHRDVLSGLASARIGVGNPQGALELYERWLQSSPNDYQAWYGAAIAHEKLGEAASRRLAGMPGAEGWSQRLLAEYWIDRGKTALASEAIEEARRLDPDQPSLNELEMAIAEGRRTTRALPSGASGPGSALYSSARDNAQAARRAFVKVLELAPDCWQSQLFLGDVARQQRKFPEAISYYTRAAELQPESPAALLGLGTVYWELADDAVATKHLESVLERTPDNWLALFALANIAVRKRDDDKAITLLQRCLRLEPNNPGIHADLGKAYLHSGQYTEAIAELRRAQHIDVRGDIHYQLAQALRKTGQTNEASAVMVEATRIREEQLKREQRLKGIR